MDIVECSNLSFAYGNKHIFRKASFSFQCERVIGILGQNGSGKTTLFDLVCRIKRPSSGIFTCHAKTPAYLSQTLTLPNVLKLRDIFHMIASLSHSGSCSATEIEAKWLDQEPRIANQYFKLWDKKVSVCSYGEIRFFFAITMLSLPNELYILDEPTAGVDPENRFLIWKAIQAAKAGGATILVSSHYIEEVVEGADEFYLINRQKLEFFKDGETYRQAFGGETLNEAFIRSVGSDQA